MCTVAIGLLLYDDRSLKGHFLVNSHPVQDPSEPASSLQLGSFFPETFPSEICLLRNYITCTLSLLLRGRSRAYGRERGCSVCWGGLGWNSEELRDLLQGLHLQELLFDSYPRCHSPQLLPIIRGTHFLSKSNNKKEETHTTRTLISLPPPLCPPPLQISRCIFPHLNKYI